MQRPKAVKSKSLEEDDSRPKDVDDIEIKGRPRFEVAITIKFIPLSFSVKCLLNFLAKKNVLFFATA